MGIIFHSLANEAKLYMKGSSLEKFFFFKESRNHNWNFQKDAVQGELKHLPWTGEDVDTF